MLQPNPQYQYQRLTATGLVKKGSGLLGGFIVASGTPTVTLYDNTSTTGVVVLNGLVTVAGTYYPLPALFTQGCWAVLSGAGDVTFLYN